MNKSQLILLKMLKGELAGEKVKLHAKDAVWGEVVETAKQHSVLPLLYESFLKADGLNEIQKERVSKVSVQTVQQNYRLLFLCRYLIRELTDGGVAVALLKGTGMASYYPTPELRKTGDIDLLLLKKEQLETAVRVLETAGFAVEEQQNSLHHVAMRGADGIEVELHTMLAEPFDNERMNRSMDALLPECGEQIVFRNTMGVLFPVLSAPYYAYELLVHMLQHFLRAGFGLKFLCDWVVFWRHGMSEEEQKTYVRLVKASGVKGFSDMITFCCIEHLGLEREKVAFMGLSYIYDTNEFMTEIFAAGEFGKTSQNRMVALRGNSPFEYFREFHHQMHLNFPKAGRVLVFWPVLWVLTLCRFLKNNRKIRKTSTAAIMKEAWRRGKIIKGLKLFR